MVAASSASLVAKSRALDTTFTLFQSTSCSKVHACSASADELKSAWATERLCSFTLCSSLRPVWPILEAWYFPARNHNTIPDCCRSGIGSLGLQSICLIVLCGLKLIKPLGTLNLLPDLASPFSRLTPHPLPLINPCHSYLFPDHVSSFFYLIPHIFHLYHIALKMVTGWLPKRMHQQEIWLL